ncbi:MAG: 2-hydroxyacid dehydrogenase [Cyanothece sp. SIO2G6]|nr:2-hydroxyacid dehydrogenase [Cyanothece sp. SIO2G6]
MKIAVFSTKRYDRQFLAAANTTHQHEFLFLETRLTPDTAQLAKGAGVVCAFINDQLDKSVLEQLATYGINHIALRSAGFNNVDLEAASQLGIKIARVPAYSPYAVAEHAVGLILMLNRKLYRAYNRVRDDNFALDGLLGFDLHGSVVGVIGTGKIGQCFAQIMRGFGCQLLGYDVYQSQVCLDLGMTYVSLEELLAQAKIISLHCPLLSSTYHLINEKTLAQVQPGTMLINTSRGGLVNTRDVIEALKSGRLGYFGADVYEEEEELFFEDLSGTVIQDDTFQRLQSFPNVVVTAHQGFFSRNALEAIATTTLNNISDFELGRDCPNLVGKD